MAIRKQPGADLGPMERAAIDNATHDGMGWIVAPVVSESLLEGLASKGLIKLERDRWRLTPMGYACSSYATVFYE